MKYLDEEIAWQMQEKKEQIRRKQEEENGILPMPKLTVEMAMEQLQQGVITTTDKTISFQPIWILEGRMCFYQPMVEPEVQVDKQEAYVMLERSENVSIQFFFAEEKEELEDATFLTYQENLKKNMKGLGILVHDLKEGRLNTEKQVKVRFLEFYNVTGFGILHNWMLFIDTGFGRVIGNMVYPGQGKEIWKPVTEAISRLLLFRSEEEVSK